MINYTSVLARTWKITSYYKSLSRLRWIVQCIATNQKNHPILYLLSALRYILKIGSFTCIVEPLPLNKIRYIWAPPSALKSKDFLQKLHWLDTAWLLARPLQSAHPGVACKVTFFQFFHWQIWLMTDRFTLYLYLYRVSEPVLQEGDLARVRKFFEQGSLSDRRAVIFGSVATLLIH